MTPEEILKQRYKVIADYPNSPFILGDILEKMDTCVSGKVLTNYCNYRTLVNHYHTPVDKYPHLFKKLEWWEERELDEMPEYVKIKSTEISLEIGVCQKVLHWGYFEDKGMKWGNEGQPFALLEIPEDTDTHDKGEKVTIHCTHLSPASTEEYENQ